MLVLYKEGCLHSLRRCIILNWYSVRRVLVLRYEGYYTGTLQGRVLILRCEGYRYSLRKGIRKGGYWYSVRKGTILCKEGYSARNGIGNL